jgi:hypothetical protein
MRKISWIPTHYGDKAATSVVFGSFNINAQVICRSLSQSKTG